MLFIYILEVTTYTFTSLGKCSAQRVKSLVHYWPLGSELVYFDVYSKLKRALGVRFSVNTPVSVLWVLYGLFTLDMNFWIPVKFSNAVPLIVWIHQEVFDGSQSSSLTLLYTMIMIWKNGLIMLQLGYTLFSNFQKKCYEHHGLI